MNFYYMKHTKDETELYKLEKKCLFGIEAKEDYFVIAEDIDVSKSPFVKFCIRNYTQTKSLVELVEYIRIQQVVVEGFKVKYIDIDGTVEFNQRHEIERIIGNEVIGDVNLSKPSITLGVTSVEGNWYFGEYLKNNPIWLEHMNRPQGYCNALTNRVSRSVLNIVTGNRSDYRIIDPCCGVGTVVIEGVSMGLDIVGSDINCNIIRGAKTNLKYFGYQDVVKVQDIKDVNIHYDIAVVDLPYGIFSIADTQLRTGIIKNAARICDKMALLGVEDVSEELIGYGYTIIEHCVIWKGNFKRNLYICQIS